MRPLVRFTNAVHVVGEYLKGVMPDETIGQRVPNPRPDRFVTLRRVGGVRRSLVSDAATITYECWGASEDDAAQLAQDVRMWLLAMPGHIFDDDRPVYSVTEVAGPAHLPDPRSAQARHVGTASVHLRGRSYSPESSE